MGTSRDVLEWESDEWQTMFKNCRKKLQKLRGERREAKMRKFYCKKCKSFYTKRHSHNASFALMPKGKFNMYGTAGRFARKP